MAIRGFVLNNLVGSVNLFPWVQYDNWSRGQLSRSSLGRAENKSMNTCRFILYACLFSSSFLFGQSVYTDQGHWIGLRAGYVPSRDNIAIVGMYEFRFERYWSAMVDLTNIKLTDNSALVVAASLRMRIPIAKYNKNIYGQFGFGSGSMYPVLFYALGFEYGIIERISLFAQYRQYSSNFDELRSPYIIYSVGLNIDLTPASVRESYLLDK